VVFRVVMSGDPLQDLPSMTLKNREACLASSCSSRSKPTSSINVQRNIYRRAGISHLEARADQRILQIDEGAIDDIEAGKIKYPRT
jgi:hypothetical protein